LPACKTMNFLESVAERQEKYERLQQEHGELRRKHNSLLQAHEKLQSENSEIHEHVRGKYDEVERAKAEVQKLQEELKQTRESGERRDCENRTLAERVKTLASSIEQSRINAHVTISGKETKMKEENELLIGQLKASADKHDALHKEHEALKQKVKDEIDSAVAYLQERHSSEIREARMTHGQSARALKEELTRERGQLQEKHKSLQQSFESLQESLREEQKKNMGLQKECKETKQDIHRIQSTLRTSIDILNEVPYLQGTGITSKCAKQVSLALQNLL